jgi:hypothetical protein
MESYDSGMDTSLYGMDSSIPCMETPVFGEDSMLGNTHAMVPKNVLSDEYFYFFIAVYKNIYADGPLGVRTVPRNALRDLQKNFFVHI